MQWADHIERLRESPHFHSTAVVNNIGLLWAPFRAKIERLLESARAAGLTVMVFETFRSQERQAELFKQKRTRIKINGCHYSGLAADVVFVDKNKRPTWNESYKGAWARLGRIGAALGLFWGGDWKSLKDCPHFQFMPATKEAMKKIRRGEVPDA